MFLLSLFLACTLCCQIKAEYKPTWQSLNSRPLPQWYDQAKIGIFIHWGVYSVPAYYGEWFWLMWNKNYSGCVHFMQKNYPPDFTYQDFAKEFTAKFFDANEWADLFVKSGAKYVVLTSKHHDGYTLWPSKYSKNWNVQDVGPRRDLVGELANSIRARNLTFGLYYSLLEWYNPLYLLDKKHSFKTQNFVQNKTLPELYEVINTYKPEVLWSDGEWEAEDSYWDARNFLAWLYNESPVNDTILVNDRWGLGTLCHHGDFYTCQDRFNPGVLQSHKWENAMSLDRKSWGFRQNANPEDYLNINELLEILARTVSCGGNLLINVGPTKEGRIINFFQEPLLQLGEWLSINGEAIYGSQPWKVQRDILAPHVWYTSKENNVYAIALQWPKKNVLKLQSLSTFLLNNFSCSLLGNKETLKVTHYKNVTTIYFPDKASTSSHWAWIIKIMTLSNKTVC